MCSSCGRESEVSYFTLCSRIHDFHKKPTAQKDVPADGCTIISRQTNKPAAELTVNNGSLRYKKAARLYPYYIYTTSILMQLFVNSILTGNITFYSFKYVSTGRVFCVCSQTNASPWQPRKRRFKRAVLTQTMLFFCSF